MRRNKLFRPMAGYSLIELLSCAALVAAVSVGVMPTIEQRGDEDRIDRIDATAKILLKAMDRHYRSHCASGSIPAVTVDSLVTNNIIEHTPKAYPAGTIFDLTIDTTRTRAVLSVSTVLQSKVLADRVASYNPRALVDSNDIFGRTVVWQTNSPFRLLRVNSSAYQANNALFGAANTSICI